MVLILLVDVIRAGVGISSVSLSGNLTASIADDEYIDEVPLIGTLPERQPSLAGKCLTFEPTNRSRSAECIRIIAVR